MLGEIVPYSLLSEAFSSLSGATFTFTDLMFEVEVTNPENSWCDEAATHLNKVHFIPFDSKIHTVNRE